MFEGKEKILLLYSGGADSRLLLELLFMMDVEPYCVLIDYGQKHVKELSYAESVCKQKEVTYCVVKIDAPIVSKLTSKGVKEYSGVSEWYVPFRNLIFLSLAASIAESRGIMRIWYGADFSDRINLFPDCYQEWVVHLNKILEVSGSSKVVVEAPLLGFSKELVQQVLKVLCGEEEVFSGYEEKKEEEK